MKTSFMGGKHNLKAWIPKSEVHIPDLQRSEGNIRESGDEVPGWVRGRAFSEQIPDNEGLVMVEPQTLSGLWQAVLTPGSVQLHSDYMP